jgi:hypothetical protein
MAVQRADWMSDAGFDSAVTAAPRIERESELRALIARLNEKERRLDEFLLEQPDAVRVAVRSGWEELEVLWQAWMSLWAARRETNDRQAATYRSGKLWLLIGLPTALAAAFVSTDWGAAIAVGVVCALIGLGVQLHVVESDRRALNERGIWLDTRWRSLCGSQSGSLQRLQVLDARRVTCDADSTDTDEWRARSWEIEREIRNELVNARYRVLCICGDPTRPEEEWRDTLTDAAIPDSSAG